MAEYYLISQLPSLDGLNENMPAPITWERFESLCLSSLGKKALSFLNDITISPPEKYEHSSNNLIEKWNNAERSLRFALAKFRAEKLKKNYDVDISTFSPLLVQAARSAVEFESPLEAEKFLNKYRLELLETFRPIDSFSDDYVYYYAIKLKLVERIRKFDATGGEKAYKNIYNTIINGDRSEDMQ